MMTGSVASILTMCALSAGAPPQVTVGAIAPPPASAAHQCVTTEIAATARAKAEANRAALGMLPTPCVGCGASTGSGGAHGSDGIAGDGFGAPPSAGFAFFPLAGVIGADIMNGQFVDLDPASPGFHDFDCRPWAYDGHRGTDAGLRSFAEQFIGMPVFAARSGTVIFAVDGEPDTNLNGGFLGNVVWIDHGDGFETQYWHLKKNSVLVSVGQQVEAGQEIGRAASSGNSFGPHLHFETVFNGPGGWEVYEPFAGACRPGQSGWIDQGGLDSDAPFLVDFGITRTFLADLSPPWWEPWELPTDAQIQTNDTWVAFWTTSYNFPQNALVRIKFTRPDGSVADDAQWNWGNSEVYRYFKTWFAWETSWLVPMVGEWRLQYWLDGQLMVDAKFLMTTSVDPAFNRPPNAIGATFEPATPAPGEALFCRVLTTNLHEDPEWDVVRYHYQWTVDGTVVRDVISAAHADAIPATMTPPGARICCTVIPSDGIVDGTGAQISALVAGLPGDATGDGVVNGADIAIVLGNWGACDCCTADRNGDGQVNGADIAIVLGSWGT